MEDTLQLGSIIEISGFSVVDRNSMVILKKVIGSYARKFSEKNVGFEKLIMALKKDEAEKTFEIEAQAKTSSNVFNSGIKDKNLFVAIGSALKNLDSQLV